MQELEIRYSNSQDGKHLLGWLKRPDINKWYPPKGKKEINDFASNWIGFSRFNASLTAIYKNEIYGIGTLFLMPYKKVAHHCMFYMIVNPEHFRKKIGTSLLKNLLNLAENYFHFESIVAEVFENSPIIGLLENYDFEKFASQNDYVKDDNEYKSRILYQHFF